jgi:hypothetical protein
MGGKSTMPSVRQFAALGLGLVLLLGCSGCKRRAKPAAPERTASGDAALNPATPVAPAKDKAGQGVYGDTSLDKLARYKKWALILRGESDPGKAGVRSAYQLMSPIEKKEFENYCLSCGVKFP